MLPGLSPFSRPEQTNSLLRRRICPLSDLVALFRVLRAWRARVSCGDPDLRGRAAVDMRKAFNGLRAAVAEQLGEDPKSGALFAFTNTERTD